MPKKCKNSEVDVAVLKEQMSETKDFIKDMNDNHLPHIYNSINSINIKLAYWSGAIIVFSAIAQILINKIF